MTGKRKIPGFILSGLFLSTCLFSASYQFFREIVVASTGYHSFEYGLFGWRSTFAEHQFIDEGDSVRGMLVDSGVTVHDSRLAAEIALWLGVGFALAVLIWYLIWRFETPRGMEREAPSKH